MAALLGVDRVCVSQDDLRERGLQVRLMDQIYGNSGSVISRSGPTSSHTAEILTVTPSTRPAFSSTREIASWHPLVNIWYIDADDTSIQQWEALLYAMAAIKETCERDYWTRMWIVQELRILGFELTLERFRVLVRLTTTQEVQQ